MPLLVCELAAALLSLRQSETTCRHEQWYVLQHKLEDTSMLRCRMCTECLQWAEAILSSTVSSACDDRLVCTRYYTDAPTRSALSSLSSSI
jgi:hypothetical protein